jgi:PAS domain S-box-containing protein
MGGTPRRDVRVLYADGEESGGRVATSLGRVDGLEVAVETGPAVAVDRLTAGARRSDCVVGGPGLSVSDALELPRRVRRVSADLPVVLCIDDESDELASDAISAGATDCVRWRERADRFSLLVDRITDAVTRAQAERTRREREFERQRDLFEQTQRIARTGGWELDVVADELRWTGEIYRIYGLPLDYEPTVDDALDFFHPEDAPILESAIDRAIEYGESYDLEIRLRTVEDDLRWVRARGEARRDAGETVALRGTLQDVTERKAREQDLRSTSNVLSTLVENIPAGILVEDDARRIRFTNGEFAELFGIESAPDELVGDDCGAAAREVSNRFVEPERFLETTDEAVAVQTTIRREEFALVDGRTFERSGTPVEFDDDRTGYLWVYQDITGRKRAENRFRALFEHLPDPGVIVELVGDDAVTRAVNGAFEDVFGYPAEEAVGASLNDLIVPEAFDSESADIDRRAREGEQLVREVRRRTADGEVRDFLFRNVLIEDVDSEPRAHGIYMDITERKRRERRLNALHEASRELMAADTQREMARIASRATCEILGLPLNGVHLYDEDADGLVPLVASTGSREVVGDPPTLRAGESIAWEAFESSEPRVYGDVRTEPTVYDPETPIRSELHLPLGEHGILLIGSTAVDDFDEADVSLAKVLAANLHAALDRLGRERALRERERELQRQNERLDGFADVVTHDLRNPLNVAMAGLDLLTETGEVEHAGTIARAHERMQRIIDDVLALAREGDAVRETRPVALDAIARRAWDNVETGGATLRAEPDRTVDADPDRLERLFENLFRNSVEHGARRASARSAHGDSVEHSSTNSRCPADGSAEDGHEELLVRVGWCDNPPGFYVEDTGPGIPEAERDRVFESGYTTATEGTGFGLAIVAETVAAHGWGVEVTEGTDGGARIEIGIDPGRE